MKQILIYLPNNFCGLAFDKIKMNFIRKKVKYLIITENNTLVTDHRNKKVQPEISEMNIRIDNFSHLIIIGAFNFEAQKSESLTEIVSKFFINQKPIVAVQNGIKILIENIHKRKIKISSETREFDYFIKKNFIPIDKCLVEDENINTIRNLITIDEFLEEIITKESTR